MNSILNKTIEMEEIARKYAFFKARSLKMEEYKKILLYKTMKKISATKELNIEEQKKEAKKSDEYRKFLYEIVLVKESELKYFWQLQDYLNSYQTFATKSELNRINLRNIHNS